MVVLWGAGTHTERLLRNYKFPLKMIEGIVDKDESRKGHVFWGKEIQSPDEIYTFQSEWVLIGTDRYYQDVLDELLKMNTGKKIQSLEKFLDNYSKKDEETTLEKYSNENRELLEKRLKNAGNIPKENLKNAKVLSSRYDVIELLPKSMIVAEVGVAYGDFSDFIIRKMQPKHFYAIDFFNKDNPYISFWGRTDFEDTKLTHEEWYKKRFENMINQNKMTVCSGLSWECMEKFEDDFFDYVYVDACHDYESVKRDIDIIVKKVKHGGYVQFNDYTLYDIYAGIYYGVVPAVNEMVKKTNSQIMYYCLNLQGFADVVIRLNKENS